MANKTSGKLYGVGIGPGDPELLTLKALRLIQGAPVLAYPAPDVGDSLARSIVADHLPGGQVEYPIRIPMVTERFPAQDVYDKAAEDLSVYLEAGQDVVVLCEGDPFFYGSFMYLFGRMMERFEVEVVPGVSSLMACAAMVGAPLAARNDVMTIIPGPVDAEIMKQRLRNVQAAAIIKVGRHFEKIRSILEELDLVDCARYVERATMDNQKVMPLSEVGDAKAPYFSMILIHKRGEAWTL
ncbi:precorrin-2 C(20)-methyltransferase [Kiloniella laminariae]|uniref:Precorrin-2 C(20)-methyltransferase n=1 Tax=Kiloniella laminariae TaxID=454162 RepID=A0ABT4LHZ4_9PROT|nr:precorrin-2 C(20)-methyltransferase [Kiloniella laminariae]MCZ4280724.1 precorrin-2 C(20)-methyltransferase [Kiloniella laminariae]